MLASRPVMARVTKHRHSGGVVQAPRYVSFEEETLAEMKRRV
jgi:hypothetical protein